MGEREGFDPLAKVFWLAKPVYKTFGCAQAPSASLRTRSAGPETAEEGSNPSLSAIVKSNCSESLHLIFRPVSILAVYPNCPNLSQCEYNGPENRWSTKSMRIWGAKKLSPCLPTAELQCSVTKDIEISKPSEL